MRPGGHGWKSRKWLREIELPEQDRLGSPEVRCHHDGADPWSEQRLVYPGSSAASAASQ